LASLKTGEAPVPALHPDDEFHPPTSDDPYWTETCWFTFTVPERRLSGQLYPFFRPNQGVLASGAYFWDELGMSAPDATYARQFWHLPIPDQPLSDIELPNGIALRCAEPQQSWEISYRDPDTDDASLGVSLDLTFTGVQKPNYLGESHLDQPGRLRGVIRLFGEEISVDSFGFRDRSWGSRSQFGQGIHGTGSAHGGYSYATASERESFHAITMDFGEGCVAIHGSVVRDGVWSKVQSGSRRVTKRHSQTGHPDRVELELIDELGRRVQASGKCLNGLGFFLNPNLYTVNCLTEWEFDGLTAFGEDHDNWSATGIRRFLHASRSQEALR
jgi:hypothetical protein